MKMKKVLSFVIAALFLSPSLAQAASIISERGTTLAQNQIKTFEPILITAEADNEITAEHGMNLIIDPNNRVLWHAVETIYFDGTAVDEGRMPASMTPQYSEDYRIVHIPVLENFREGEAVRVAELKMRAYDREMGSRFLYLDITGDLVGETQDLNRYTVTATVLGNATAPYPPSSVKAELAEDLKSVHLTWNNPADWDFEGNILERKRIRNGQELNTELFRRMTFTEYTDNDIEEGDVITYTLFSQDIKNQSEPVIINLTVEQPEEPEEPVEEPEEPAEEPSEPVEEPQAPEVDENETEELEGRFSYLKVRHAIKCREGGSVSNCIWAKAQLMYAQEILDRSEVNLSLSESDLELMRDRLPFWEDRRERRCVNAVVPGKTCPALTDLINRAYYFLD